MNVPPETWHTFLFLIWIAQSKVVRAANMYVKLHKNTTDIYCARDGECPDHDPAKRVAEDICSSLVAISNPGQLFFSQDYQHLQRPWVDNPTTTAPTSPTITEAIHSVLHLEVEGLDGETVMNIIQELQQNGCLSFPISAFVRDQFLGESTTDTLGLESNCDCHKLYHICLEKWGFSNCVQIGECNILHIGNRAINGDNYILDSANWNKTFFGDGTNLQYTTNSIAYFADDFNIVIDITGQGVSDTCNKVIRIPVAADHWEQLVSPDKLFSFWKLRVMGYRAADANTMLYVISKTKLSIMEAPEHFGNFYCTEILNGQWKNSACFIASELCSEALNKREIFNTMFEIDLDEFWSDKVKPLVDGLECGSCSSFISQNIRGGVVKNKIIFLHFFFFVIGGIMFF